MAVREMLATYGDDVRVDALTNVVEAALDCMAHCQSVPMPASRSRIRS